MARCRWRRVLRFDGHADRSQRSISFYGLVAPTYFDVTKSHTMPWQSVKGHVGKNCYWGLGQMSVDVGGGGTEGLEAYIYGAF